MSSYPKFQIDKRFAIDNISLAFWTILFAAQIGDETEIAQLNELNRFQMFGHYYECAVAQERFYPNASMEAKMAVTNAMFGQAIGWYRDRVALHQMGMEPISMNRCDNKGMRDGKERRKARAKRIVQGVM